MRIPEPSGYGVTDTRIRGFAENPILNTIDTWFDPVGNNTTGNAPQVVTYTANSLNL